jgi:hypothetical protein
MEDFTMTIGQLKNWIRSTRAPNDAKIRLNVGGHVGSATGWALGWALDDNSKNVLVLTADEDEEVEADGPVR